MLVIYHQNPSNIGVDHSSSMWITQGTLQELRILTDLAGQCPVPFVNIPICWLRSNDAMKAQAWHTCLECTGWHARSRSSRLNTCGMESWVLSCHMHPNAKSMGERVLFLNVFLICVVSVRGGFMTWHHFWSMRSHMSSEPLPACKHCKTLVPIKLK